MAELTPEEVEVISQNPLNSSLDLVRHALCNVQAPIASDQAAYASIDSERPSPDVRHPKMFSAVMNQLFSTLSASEIALSLASRTGRDFLASDLLLVRSLLQRGRAPYHLFHSLSQAVLQCASDVDVWSAVIALIRATRHDTPPPSLPPSFDTPITHSSASQQGSEQTRQKLEPRVFDEIRSCTYRAVDGFHEKVFRDKRWSRRAKRAWETLRTQYDPAQKRWLDLPDTPSEDKCCDWWLGLAKQVLSSEKSVYCRSTTKKKVGNKETKRQLDLMVKSKSAAKPSTAHRWQDIIVMGELKRSEKTSKALWLQLGSAVRNVFASQPTRRFVHAFTLTGTNMENWVFDRSGPYSGSVFNVHEDPERFVEVMCGYVMMGDEELGLDTYMQHKDDKFVVSVLETGGRGRKRRKLELDPEPIAFQRAIVCRGTSCYRSRAGVSAFDGVVKFSWTSDLRPPEAELLEKANARGVKGLAKLVGFDQITSIQELREGLAFEKSHPFRDFGENSVMSHSQSLPPSHSINRFAHLTVTGSHSLKRKSSELSGQTRKRVRPNSNASQVDGSHTNITYAIEDPKGTSLAPKDPLPYANRIFRVLAISPTGRSISRFKSVLELLEGLRDAIKVHRSLFMDGRILHRDISENNIIITDSAEADGYKGMLIDLDLAKEIGEGPSGARHRTGTMEFMAIEVLLRVSHTYRHDLEAFFYVLIWLCVRRGWSINNESKSTPNNSALSHWYTGTYKDIARNKRGDMDRGGLEDVLKDFPVSFEPVKPLCRAIRDALFPYKDGLFTGTPQNPSILYEPIISAYDEALTAIKRAQQQTRES